MEKRVIDRFIEQRSMERKAQAEVDNTTLEEVRQMIRDKVYIDVPEENIVDEVQFSYPQVGAFTIKRIIRQLKGEGPNEDLIPCASKKVDKQLDYAKRLIDKVDREATTFDKPNWSSPGRRPGGIYRSAKKVVAVEVGQTYHTTNKIPDARTSFTVESMEGDVLNVIDILYNEVTLSKSKVGQLVKAGHLELVGNRESKEAKMNIKAMLVEMWDRGMIGDKTIEVLKASKNEKLVLGEIQKIAKKKGYDIKVVSQKKGNFKALLLEALDEGDPSGGSAAWEVFSEAGWTHVEIVQGINSLPESGKIWSIAEGYKSAQFRGPEEFNTWREVQDWLLWDLGEEEENEVEARRKGSNTDGQVSTKERHGYPDGDKGETRKGPSTEGTEQRLPGVAEPSKPAVDATGNERRMPGVKEPAREPWTDWKQRYDLRENDIADSPIPASSGGTDKRLPGVKEPEFNPRGPYPSTQAKKVKGQESEEFEIYYNDLIPETQERFLSFQGMTDPSEGNYDDFPIAIVSKSLEDEEEKYEGGPRESRTAQHRTPQELMKEKIERDRKIEGMPHEPKFEPSKQETLGEPETKIKEQSHGKTTDSLGTVGEVNPSPAVDNVKGDTPSPLGYPESQTDLSKSLKGFFTGVDDGTERKGQEEGAERTPEEEIVICDKCNKIVPCVDEGGLCPKCRGIEGGDVVAKKEAQVADFSLKGEGEPKFEWSGIPGETNQAPKVDVTPPLSEQKSTTVPSISKGEDNQPPSKSALAVHCNVCKGDIVLSEDGYNEWIKEGKTICKCGNLIETEYDMKISEDLFSGAPKEGDDRDLIGKKKKAKKPQCNWEIKY